DDAAAFAGLKPQARVLYILGLLAEDRAQQALFRRELGFALRRYLADQDVAAAHLGADPDDAVLVEIAELHLGNVRDIRGSHLGPEFGVADRRVELFNVNGRELALLHQALGDADGVFVVGAGP